MTDITDTQAENLYDAMYRAINDTMPRIHDADVGRWLVGWMEDYGWTVEPPPEPRYKVTYVAVGDRRWKVWDRGLGRAIEELCTEDHAALLVDALNGDDDE